MTRNVMEHEIRGLPLLLAALSIFPASLSYSCHPLHLIPLSSALQLQPFHSLSSVLHISLPPLQEHQRADPLIHTPSPPPLPPAFSHSFPPAKSALGDLSLSLLLLTHSGQVINMEGCVSLSHWVFLCFFKFYSFIFFYHFVLTATANSFFFFHISLIFFLLSQNSFTSTLLYWTEYKTKPKQNTGI